MAARTAGSPRYASRSARKRRNSTGATETAAGMALTMASLVKDVVMLGATFALIKNIYQNLIENMFTLTTEACSMQNSPL